MSLCKPRGGSPRTTNDGSSYSTLYNLRGDRSQDEFKTESAANGNPTLQAWIPIAQVDKPNNEILRYAHYELSLSVHLTMQ